MYVHIFIYLYVYINIYLFIYIYIHMITYIGSQQLTVLTRNAPVVSIRGDSSSSITTSQAVQFSGVYMYICLYVYTIIYIYIGCFCVMLSGVYQQTFSNIHMGSVHSQSIPLIPTPSTLTL
jgi:hypothetical protein